MKRSADGPVDDQSRRCRPMKRVCAPGSAEVDDVSVSEHIGSLTYARDKSHGELPICQPTFAFTRIPAIPFTGNATPVAPRELIEEAAQSHSPEEYWLQYKMKALERANSASVQMQELFKHPTLSPCRVCAGTYLADVRWFLDSNPELVAALATPDAVHARARREALLIVHGEQSEQRREIENDVSSLMKELGGNITIRLHVPKLPLPFGTAHAKFFLVEFVEAQRSSGLVKRLLRIVVTTANLIEKDWSYKNQHLFLIDLPIGGCHAREMATAAATSPVALPPSLSRTPFCEAASASSDEVSPTKEPPIELGGKLQRPGTGQLLSPPRENLGCAESTSEENGPGHTASGACRRALSAHAIDARTTLKAFLENYLGTSNYPWKIEIDKADWSLWPHEVTILASIPGVHYGPSNSQWGLGALGRLVPERYAGSGLPGAILQFSSMGSLSEAWLSALQRALRVTQWNVVFPSVEDVRFSWEGWQAGGSLPVQSRNWKEFLLRRWCPWSTTISSIRTMVTTSCAKLAELPSSMRESSMASFRAGPLLAADAFLLRSLAMPHTKTILGLKERLVGNAVTWRSLEDRMNATTELAYLYVGSHNLSKAAWGEWQKNGVQLQVRSYELGIFVSSARDVNGLSARQGLACGFTNGPMVLALGNELDTGQYEQRVFPLPYLLPPETSSDGVPPWSVDLKKKYGSLGLDRHGNVL